MHCLICMILRFCLLVFIYFSILFLVSTLCTISMSSLTKMKKAANNKRTVIRCSRWWFNCCLSERYICSWWWHRYYIRLMYSRSFFLHMHNRFSRRIKHSWLHAKRVDITRGCRRWLDRWHCSLWLRLSCSWRRWLYRGHFGDTGRWSGRWSRQWGWWLLRWGLGCCWLLLMLPVWRRNHVWRQTARHWLARLSHCHVIQCNNELVWNQSTVAVNVCQIPETFIAQRSVNLNVWQHKQQLPTSENDKGQKQGTNRARLIKTKTSYESQSIPI